MGSHRIVGEAVDRAGVKSAVPGVRFPVIVRGGTLKNGHTVRYAFNYSAQPRNLAAPAAVTDLVGGRTVAAGERIDLPAWGFAILEEGRGRGETDPYVIECGSEGRPVCVASRLQQQR